MTPSRSTSLREVWAARMQRFQQQNTTVQKFCTQQGVSPSNFYYWKRKLAHAQNANAPKFLPVTTTKPTTEATRAFPTLKLPGGGCIELPRDLSREQWADLLAACGDVASCDKSPEEPT